MQTLTFTQKLLRQRHFFSSLIPLLALFVGLSTSFTAQAQVVFYDDALNFDLKPTGSPSANPVGYYGQRFANPITGDIDAPYDTYTPLGTTSTTPATPSPSLGTYDIENNGSQLTLTGGSVVATPVFLQGFGSTGTLLGARMKYRVYLDGTAVSLKPTFSILPLNEVVPSPFGFRQQYVATTNVNLLVGLLSGGIYVIESYFEVDFRSNLGITRTYQDPSTVYTAAFTVTAPTVTPPGGTTTWVATVSTDWTVAANWSNGVPTQSSDAIIPEKNGTNANTSTPELFDSDPSIYNVRTLTMNGTASSNRALLRIGRPANAGSVANGATLNVYGDLNTFSGGILAPQAGDPGIQNPLLNSTIAMRGNNQQVVRGLLVIQDLTISGTGAKLVVNSIEIGNTMTFLLGTTAKVRTVTETFNPSTGVSSFAYNSTKTSNVDLKSMGLLSGETKDAYIDGVTLAENTLQANIPQTFGNIGVDITPNRNITTNVEITRTVGDPLNGPVGRSARPVKRQYTVLGGVNDAPTISTLVFHYLDSELNDNPELNLIIFRTVNGGIPYGIIGGEVNTINNTVTKTGVGAINTITLGDKANPLPVRLTAFDAKRVGTDALVTWETASELNSRGYEVQVSTTGKEFRTLASVASAAPNTNRTTQYRYIDKEANKSGTRYYRLRQIDLDGKEAFFNPVAVSFTGKATETALVAYPNPINGNEQLHLTFQSANAGKGQISITDMTGRMVRQQPIDVTAGTSDLTVEKLDDLKMGMYLVRLTLPSGQVQNLKVVKQ